MRLYPDKGACAYKQGALICGGIGYKLENAERHVNLYLGNIMKKSPRFGNYNNPGISIIQISKFDFCHNFANPNLNRSRNPNRRVPAEM